MASGGSMSLPPHTGNHAQGAIGMHEPARQRSGQEPKARLTMHASQRMTARGITETAVRAVLDHGRIVHVRGAAVHALGRKEVRCFRRRGIDLAPYEGIHIVCTPDGTILTVYRNQDFRGLRPRFRHRTTAREAYPLIAGSPFSRR